MKHLIATFLFSLIFICESWTQYSHEAHSFYSEDEKYSYQAVTGDPIGAKVYTLDNGFQFWFIPDPYTPFVEARVVVRAGSTQDPAKAMGTAYLTSQLLQFGTDRLGTTNYAMEKPILDSLSQMLENWRTSHQSLDMNLARSLCIRANEIACYASDPLDASIQGPTSRISPDYTTFHFSIQPAAIKKSLVYMAELFRNPVFRGIDRVLQQGNGGTPVAEEFSPSVLENLFPNHPYGTHPLSGTNEALQQPSIPEIRSFFNQWYGPNNMALILQGNLNEEALIKMVDSTFGKLGRRDIPFIRFPKWNAPLTNSFESPQIHEGALVFRGRGIETEDPVAMELMQYLFGLLVEEETAKGNIWTELPPPTVSIRHLADGTIQTITPNNPQQHFTPTEAELAIVEIINRIKTGEFEAWQIREAADRAEKYRDERISPLDKAETAFGIGWDWTEYQNRFDWMRSQGKEDVQHLAGRIYAHYAVAKSPKPATSPKFQSPLPAIDYLDGLCFPRNEWERGLAQIPNNSQNLASKKARDRVESLHGSAGEQLIWIEQHDSALFALEIYLDRTCYPWLDWTGECEYLCQLGGSALYPDSIRRYFNGKGILIAQEAQYVKISISGLGREFETMLGALTQVLNAEPNWEVVPQTIEHLAAFPTLHFPFSVAQPFGALLEEFQWPTPSQTQHPGLTDSIQTTINHWRELPQAAYMHGPLQHRSKLLQWLSEFRRPSQRPTIEKPIVFIIPNDVDSSVHFSWLVPLMADFANMDHRERVAMRELLQTWPQAEFSIPKGYPPYILSSHARSWWPSKIQGQNQYLRWDGKLSSQTQIADLKALVKEAKINPADPEKLAIKIEALRNSDEVDALLLRTIGLNYLDWFQWPQCVTTQVTLGYLCGTGDYLIEQRYQQSPQQTVLDIQKAWQKYLKPQAGVWYIRAPKHLLIPELYKDLGEVRVVK